MFNLTSILLSLQHQPQHPHLPRQVLQQIRLEILQILIHCGWQEVGYLNDLP